MKPIHTKRCTNAISSASQDKLRHMKNIAAGTGKGLQAARVKSYLAAAPVLGVVNVP